jgi:hypothetical protein
MISGWANNSIHESPHYYKSHIHLISSPPQHFSNCSFCSIIRGGGEYLEWIDGSIIHVIVDD